jgi:hypothetical protein
MHDSSGVKIPPLSLSDNLKFLSPLTGEGRVIVTQRGDTDHLPFAKGGREGFDYMISTVINGV